MPWFNGTLLYRLTTGAPAAPSLADPASAASAAARISSGGATRDSASRLSPPHVNIRRASLENLTAVTADWWWSSVCIFLYDRRRVLEAEAEVVVVAVVAVVVAEPAASSTEAGGASRPPNTWTRRSRLALAKSVVPLPAPTTTLCGAWGIGA